MWMAGNTRCCCGDGNPGTPLRGEIWRDHAHAVAHMTNQKGHKKLGKETFIFWLLNTRCTQLRAKLIHSLNPPAVAEWHRPTTVRWDPNWGNGERGEAQQGTQRGILSASKGSLHTAFSLFPTQPHSVSQIYGSCDVWSSFHLFPACSQSHGEIVPCAHACGLFPLQGRLL